MKLIIIASVLALSTSAFAAAPKCVNIGSKSERWQMADGKLIKARCKDHVAFCDAIGTRSEVWYAAAVARSKLIVYETCTAGSTPWPRCVNIGTKSEGWQIGAAPVRYDQCAKKVAACIDGSKSEGWYAVTTKGPKRRLQWKKCSARS